MKLTETLQIYIGYDEVESVAYHTLAHSVINRSSVPVSIHPIKLSLFDKMYSRQRDPKQSNEFSFSRFLVPYLQGYTGWALFMDCDMMLRTDINELFKLRDPTKSVMVCQHDYTPSDKTKYLGNVQYQYPRKNWSSVMLFNCAHQHCRNLTPEYINTAPALALHRFNWTEDERLGSLPLEWNWLVGEYKYNPDVKNIHWTVGGPWFYEYENTDYANEWFKERDDMLSTVQRKDIKTVVSGR